MELQQQVTNLELSKRMKELGFKQEGLFMYREWKTGMLSLDYLPHKNAFGYNPTLDFLGSYTAYTVAELGEMLPKECKSFKEGKDFYWECERIGADKYRSVSGGNTEADARARMLIYLKENNLL
ncbi:MAG: hypothetical protein PHR33_02940 [Bacilli bacterium]|nr:hypothetical protein [Bacilli bacterium]